MTKTGYVRKYELINWLTALPLPEDVTEFAYYKVYISDVADRDQNLKDFELRMRESQRVNAIGDDYWAVSYGTTEMAIIATLRDAFLHGKRVRISTPSTRSKLIRWVTVFA